MTEAARPLRSAAYGALLILMLTYMVSYIDRMALGVLQEQIKAELGLSDWQLGLLSGPAFALLYSVMGLPIARLAERSSRTMVLAASLAVWSAMTMLCGLARNYTQLLLARAGVSIGEAGCNPAAHSLIADLFPPQERGRAIAFYSLGAPLGALLGAIAAGWLAHHWGWRTAFLMLGPPGFILAIVILFFMPKPRRGQFDAAAVGSSPPSSAAPPPFREVVKAFFGNSALRHLAAGSSLIVLVGYGVAAFLPSFLIRRHGLDLESVGLLSGVINGAGAAVGTLGSGFIIDRFGGRDARYYAWFPAIMVAGAVPCFVIGFLTNSLALSAVLLTLATTAIYTYIAPVFAQLHNILHTRMRATGTSIMYLVLNLVGLGLGPPLIGLISDYMTRLAIAGVVEPGQASGCSGAAASLPVCQQAAGMGLSHALVIISLILVVAVVHFWRAGLLIGAQRPYDAMDGRTIGTR